MNDKDILTQLELDDIRKRNQRSYPEPPEVRISFEERLINRIPRTDLYLRRRKDKDEMTQYVKVFEEFKPIFDEAYIAISDRRRLLEHLSHLELKVNDLANIRSSEENPRTDQS